MPLLAVLAAVVMLLSAVCAVLYKVDSAGVHEKLLTEAMARNDLRAKQLAGSVGQLTAAIIRLFDMALLQLRDAGTDGGADVAGVAALIQKHLPPGSANLVLVLDAEGKVTYTSARNGLGTYLGDRPYFRFLAENDQDQLFIAAPVETRLGTQRWAIPLARAIRKDGHFLGVVVIGLLPEYLSVKFSELSLNPGDVVALILTDGTFLSRNPSLAEAMGRKAPADRPFLDPTRGDDETTRSISSVDNIPVNFAWKHLPDWPLISVVALDERAELGPIRSAVASARLRTDITIAIVLASSLVISGLLLWARRQQKLLANTGDLLRSIMDSLPSSIAVVDEKGEIIQVNQAWRDFARENEAPASVIHGIGLDYFGCCSADENDRLASEALAGMQAVLGDQLQRFIQEYPCHSPSQERWFEFRVTPLVGAQRGLVTSHIEITERKLAQHRLEKLLVEQKTILDNELIGIAMLRDRSIVWTNPAFEKMHGYGPGELAGVSIRQVYPDDDTYLSSGAEAYAVLNAGGVYRTQCEHACKDGRLVWMEINGTVLPGDSGTYLWGVVDISERKALELSLRKTNTELERFAYVASHDLRQPLRMVTSYLDIIDKKLGPQLDGDLRKYLGFAVDGARRMDRLIVGLLEYSRTGRSAESLPVPLGDAVADAVANLTVAIREAGATVSVADQMPTITSDPTEMTRLFQNLIGNAIKYRSPDRPPQVEVGWKARQNNILVWVKDNGMGIAPENCERAFQIFQRLVPKDTHEGFGIGLAVCKKIVERLGGRIWIESEVGAGSTFFLTLPLMSENNDASA